MTKTVLNCLVAASAFAAIVANWLEFEAAFILLKPFTTILVICVAVLAGTGAGAGRNMVTLIVVALLACLCGDVLLLDDRYFVYGLGAFLVAHVLFATVFYQLSGRRVSWRPLIPLLVFGGIYFSILLPRLGNLALPVAVYISCILVMCWLGVNVWLARRDRVGQYLAIAALLFVFSDSIIAVNKFLWPFDLSNAVILTAYWASIAIVANMVPAASRQLPVV